MAAPDRRPRLVALATASPAHVVHQADVRTLAQGLFAGALGETATLLQVFEHAQIETRQVCVPLEWFGEDHTFGEKNDRYITDAKALAGEAARRALAAAGLAATDIDHIVFVSSTGIATPSIDARIAGEMGFRPDVRRTPIWGLGCAGGAAGLARAAESALADPTARILFLALELCSLTFQRDDHSKRNLVAASLFADGAAAAIIVGHAAKPVAGERRRALAVVASESILWRDTVDVMGWDVDSAGLHVVFSRDIPTIVREKLGPSLAAFLARHDLTFADLDHLALHPGGVKVLRAYAEVLGRDDSALRHAREVLRDHGNMSSPSCLFVLERFLAASEILPGDRVLMAALGPGFAAEYVLLEGVA